MSSEDRKEYFRSHRQTQRKTKNLENIISTLASPQKRKVIRNVSGNINLAEVVAFTGSISFCEGIACQAIMSHLKELCKRSSFTKFHILLNNLFSDHFDDGECLRWLAHKLGNITCKKVLKNITVIISKQQEAEMKLIGRQFTICGSNASFLLMAKMEGTWLI